jgi:hypothetical protein
MKIRDAAWLAAMTLAGILSAAVTLYGMYSANSVDFRQNTVLTSLFCLLPILSFPVFLLVRPARRSTAMLAMLAIAYLAVYSRLDWRTCAELGYCGSVASTVLETLRTRPVLEYFGVAIFSFAALLVDDRTTGKDTKK